MKRILHFVLSSALLLSVITPIHASAETQAEVEQVITALDIMTGDQYGNLNLSQKITRAQFTTMAVNVLLGNNQVATPTTSPYPDVSRNHWAAPYVTAGVQYGLISGYSDGTFRPDAYITLGEASVIIPKLLGYSNSDFTSSSMDGRVLWMSSNGILDDVTTLQAGETITRYDTMYMFYNALTAQTKQGITLLQSMGHSLTASGEIDRVALLTNTMEGPVQATSSWRDQLPFTNFLSIYLNGNKITAEQILPNDLIYWSQSARTLWVYRSQVTGILGSLSAQNTITIAGNTYAIETEQARYALSNLGTYRQGDMVTALLGKDGGIAVISSPYAQNEMVSGTVLSLSTASYSDGAGGTYQGPAITLLATDENIYTYPLTNPNIEVEDVVQISTSSTGTVEISRVYSTSLSGAVGAGGSSIGGTPISSDVEILDIYNSTGVRIYPSRLDGLTLTSSDILYHRLDANGEIDRLILDDVTGEMHTYGILDEKTEYSYGASLTVMYEMTLPTGPAYLQLSKSFTGKEGPIAVLGTVQNPDNIVSLVQSTVTDLGTVDATVNGDSYPYAQNLVVYEKVDGDYYLSTLARVSTGDFSKITACYRSSSDPYIRILLAQ